MYLVGPLTGPLTYEMSAVLACGPGAVLSHRSAAALWRISPAWRGPIDVTVAGSHPRSRRGVRVHRSRSLEATRRERVPLTAPARTLELVRTAGLPAPETNAHLLGYEVDFLWRAAKLVVEVDGFAYHSTREAFERDRRRDARLQAAGFRVVRFTYRQIVAEPDSTIACLDKYITFA